MSHRTLKRIALITMIIDHIGAFIPGAPIWLRYIGRISAPIFFFCCAHSL
ncbi:MAG: conjugal transfer protein TraX, partial [Lachnospiraceae bacterium]|nr:conjugal transfer protein TraX [Lachnospiraceae bacterium]